jgi:hypothetical protein
MIGTWFLFLHIICKQKTLYVCAYKTGGSNLLAVCRSENVDFYGIVETAAVFHVTILLLNSIIEEGGEFRAIILSGCL